MKKQKALNKEDYASGWDELETALDNGRNVRDDDKATQEEVDDAVSDLEDAMSKLVVYDIPEGYVLAKDTDFIYETVTMGTIYLEYYKYIGTDEYVVIPHTIRGDEIKSYFRMFYDSPVKGVASNNPNVTNMRSMFLRSKATTLDLRHLDTSKVTDMREMFRNSQTTEIIGLDKFDTSNVTNMREMFYGSEATTLDLSSFDTSNVTNMSSMFYYSQAKTLDLSSFDTSKVTDMSYMFYNSQATTGYARTQSDADRFNASEEKPSRLTFVVKQ